MTTRQTRRTTTTRRRTCSRVLELFVVLFPPSPQLFRFLLFFFFFFHLFSCCCVRLGVRPTFDVEKMLLEHLSKDIPANPEGRSRQEQVSRSNNKRSKTFLGECREKKGDVLEGGIVETACAVLHCGWATIFFNCAEKTKSHKRETQRKGSANHQNTKFFWCSTPLSLTSTFLLVFPRLSKHMQCF